MAESYPTFPDDMAVVSLEGDEDDPSDVTMSGEYYKEGDKDRMRVTVRSEARNREWVFHYTFVYDENGEKQISEIEAPPGVHFEIKEDGISFSVDMSEEDG